VSSFFFVLGHVVVLVGFGRARVDLFGYVCI
jgi:hypothetical protein